MLNSHRNFQALLNTRWREANSCAAVGIDPDLSKIPDIYWRQSRGEADAQQTVISFCTEVIKTTAPYVCAYKIQPAFFYGLGEYGDTALKAVVEFCQQYCPEIPLILDGKFSDISNTLAQYVAKYFGNFGVDAVLVNPLMGSESITPFSEWRDKGVFVLCRTSNSSSSELLELETKDGRPLWRVIADLAITQWNLHRNIGLVMSANAPSDLKEIRTVAPNTPILLAGVGAQGGSLEDSIPLVIDEAGYGVIVPSSRAVIFAEAYGNETHVQAMERVVRELRDSINRLAKP